MDACRFAASSLIIFALVSCGRKDDSQDLERYLKNFSLSIVDGTGKRVVGDGPNQISPTEVIIYNEEWEETGYSFIEVCDVGAFDLDFYLTRPNPRYLASDYYDLFYVSLGDDVDTLILSFGEKVEVQYTDPVLTTTDYFPTIFQYNNFVLSELGADASDCESFILYK